MADISPRQIVVRGSADLWSDALPRDHDTLMRRVVSELLEDSQVDPADEEAWDREAERRWKKKVASARRALTEDQRHRLERVAARVSRDDDVDPLMTLICDGGILAEIAYHDAAAAINKVAGGSVIDHARALRDAVVKRGRAPASRSWDADDYDAMAEFVWRRTGEKLSADGPVKFFYGDEPVLIHMVDAVVHACISSQQIWDPVKKQRVLMSNRLVGEVRGALARKYPHRSEVGESVQIRPEISGSARVAQFVEERTVVGEGWVSSSALWGAWVDWVTKGGGAVGNRDRFFRELYKISSGQRARRRQGGEPEWGIEGIKIL